MVEWGGSESGVGMMDLEQLKTSRLVQSAVLIPFTVFFRLFSGWLRFTSLLVELEGNR